MTKTGEKKASVCHQIALLMLYCCIRSARGAHLARREDAYVHVRIFQVCLSFYAKTYKQSWFSTKEQKIYWEQWVLPVFVSTDKDKTSAGVHSALRIWPFSRSSTTTRWIDAFLLFCQFTLQRVSLTLENYVDMEKMHPIMIICTTVIYHPSERDRRNIERQTNIKERMLQIIQVSPRSTLYVLFVPVYLIFPLCFWDTTYCAPNESFETPERVLKTPS